MSTTITIQYNHTVIASRVTVTTADKSPVVENFTADSYRELQQCIRYYLRGYNSQADFPMTNEGIPQDRFITC